MLKKVFLLLFFPITISAQSGYFEIVYGTAANDFSRSVKQINSGSIYVFGNSDSGAFGGSDLTLSKLDKYGNLIWTNYYGTVNNESGFYLNTTSDGNLVFVGQTEAGSNNLDVLIYKVDTLGAVIWNKSFATPVNEFPRYVEQTRDGGYIIGGSINDVFGHYDLLSLKLDSNGDYQWDQTYGQMNNDIGDQIHETATGYIFTGDSNSYGLGDTDVVVFGLDSLGNELWVKKNGDATQNGCQGIYPCSDGNFISYGETETFTFSPFDFYLQKMSPEGDSLWRYTYGGTYADAAFSIVEDMDGSFICTGYSNSYNGGAPIDLVIFKVDSAGVFLWQETYGNSGIDIGYEIIRSVDGNGFIITGKTFESGSEQYYLLKLNNRGEVGIIENTTVSDQLLDAYPNPSSGAVNFLCKLKPDAKNTKIRLTDLSGRMLSEKTIVSEIALKMDLSDVSTGMYFYSLVVDEAVVDTKKLVVGY